MFFSLMNWRSMYIQIIFVCKFSITSTTLGRLFLFMNCSIMFAQIILAPQISNLNGFFPSWTAVICLYQMSFWGKFSITNVTFDYYHKCNIWMTSFLHELQQYACSNNHLFQISITSEWLEWLLFFMNWSSMTFHMSFVCKFIIKNIKFEWVLSLMN